MKPEDRCPGKRIQEPTRSINGGDNGGGGEGIFSAVTTASLSFRACSRGTRLNDDRVPVVFRCVCFLLKSSVATWYHRHLARCFPQDFSPIPGPDARGRPSQNIKTNNCFVFSKYTVGPFFGIVEKSCFFRVLSLAQLSARVLWREDVESSLR